MSDQIMGTLYGLGVGPGDPGLLTLKAVEVLDRVEVVFAAGSSKNHYSRALEVVREHLRPGCSVERLPFPMTRQKQALQRAWQENAARVLAVLQQGIDAAFLTLGDPLTYSTFIYLMRTLRDLEPGAPVVTVPGVTAFAAAAARLNLPLAEGDEALMVVPGVSGSQEVARLATCGDNLVILKAYRNYDEIIDALAEEPHCFDSQAASNVGLPEESLAPKAASQKGTAMPYLTTVIAKRRKEK